MLKQTVLLFLCVLFLCQCQTENNKTNIDAELIKGDWIGFNETQYVSFGDTTVRGYAFRSGVKYEVRKDTLIVEDFTDENQAFLRRLAIVVLTSDSLVLKEARETYQYVRPRIKNNITPKTISFASSGCYGNCPVMQLEIDSLRNIRFNGEMHTSKSGGFTGKISENEYNSLIARVRTLPLDSLKPFYEAPWTDDETLGISIVHGNKVIRTSIYGHNHEPMELYVLLEKLKNLYKEVDLKPDPSVEKDGVFSNPAAFPVLSPPPPKITLEE